MTEQEVKEIVRRDLPAMVEHDTELREVVARMLEPRFANKQHTESRFDRVLEELRRGREEQARKWAQQDRQWEEQNRKWEEHNREWREAQAEENRKWEENQQELRQLCQAIDTMAQKHEASIGALGARWGIYSEEAFRNGMKGLLQSFRGIEVLNVTEYDDDGEVFGRPDQVELDIIVRDGVLILCELKSSVSKPDVYAFERKVRFYEKRHQRQASRLMIISPMVDSRAQAAAQKLGIEVYTQTLDVSLEEPQERP
jgi:hypothetical protein